VSEFDLFLSHNGTDKPWTERLAVAIEADGSGPPLKVFFDKWDILPGSDVPSELENGLQNSRYVGLVLTPEALASDWVALERSTAIYRDPRARQHSLIPLLRRDCAAPDMLARLNLIDFRGEQDFGPGVEKLVDLLRGRPVKRGGDSGADLYLREDAALLRRQRTIFDRPAFRTSCIWELFISELIGAIDDTVAAINTGSLYSRNRNLMASFPDKNQYILEEFKGTFSRIGDRLGLLKRKVVEFEYFFRKINPEYSHHQNFYAMLMGSIGKVKDEEIRSAVNFMDDIDGQRNQILRDLNVLLLRSRDTPFAEIELSSRILKEGHIGGAQRVAPLLEKP
jgi:TIR domain